MQTEGRSEDPIIGANTPLSRPHTETGSLANTDVAAHEAETPDFVLPPAQSPLASLDSVAPLLLFVVINARFFVLSEDVGSKRLWFGAAVVASIGWSLFSLIRRRKQGLPIGKFIPIVTAWLVIRGLVGVITGNEQVFFGMSIGAKIAIGLALLGSVVVGKSFAGSTAPLIFGFSERVQEHEAYRSGMAVVTVIGAIYEFLSAGFDWWLLFLQEASANEFVLIRYVVNWGASTAALLGAYLYIGRKLREIEGFPGLLAILEAQVEAQADRMGWDISVPGDEEASPDQKTTQ